MFSLPFIIPPSSEKIQLNNSVFCIGSCFSDNIGHKLQDHKFKVVSNPFGVIYNPYSIFKNFRNLLTDNLDIENYIQQGDIFYHWDTHSDISATTLSLLKEMLKQRANLSKESLTTADWIIITFGTAYAYKYLESDEIVANCHKVPQSNFDRVLLTKMEITKDYFRTVDLIKSLNPNVKIIITVSPVRHVRDGLVNNNLSKSILLQAAHEIVERDQQAHYFPSYEIMIDELRDYRYYKEDMIHPTDQAITYIWEKFTKSYLDENTQNFIQEWQKINRAIHHRPFHPTSDAHQQFLKSTIKKLETLSQQVDVIHEIELLKSQIIDA